MHVYCFVCVCVCVCRLLIVLAVATGALGHHLLPNPHRLVPYNIVKWSVFVCLSVCVVCVCACACVHACMHVCMCIHAWMHVRDVRIARTSYYSTLQMSKSCSTLVVYWTKPQSNGSPVTAYHIELNGKRVVTVTGALTEAALTNLAPQTDYK